MPLQTNSQRMAQAAYQALSSRNLDREFSSFAREFPSLIHSCGLAQAVAFARAKKDRSSCGQYLADLSAVLTVANNGQPMSPEQLDSNVRECSAMAYIRLSRNALQAAGWLKRYVEALAQD